MPSLPVDTYLSLSQLNVLFQLLIINMLGLSDALTSWLAWQASPVGDQPPNPYESVRVSWPTSGAPAWGITEDVSFIQITEEDAPMFRPRDVTDQEYTDTQINQITSYTRVIRLGMILYGPNSFDRAQTIRDQIYYQQNHDLLAQNNLYLVPDIRAPRRFPEFFQSQWWERTDLAMTFNNLVVRNLAVQTVGSQQITIQTDDITQTIATP